MSGLIFNVRSLADVHDCMISVRYDIELKFLVNQLCRNFFLKQTHTRVGDCIVYTTCPVILFRQQSHFKLVLNRFRSSATSNTEETRFFLTQAWQSPLSKEVLLFGTIFSLPALEICGRGTLLAQF